MRTVKALLVTVTVLVLAMSIVDMCAANSEPVQQVQQINNTGVIKQIPSDSRGDATYQPIPFAFTGWGAYGGYIENGKKYLQDYRFSKCLLNDTLPPNQVCQILIDSKDEQVISLKQSSPIFKGYQLIINFIDIGTTLIGPELSLLLTKNGKVVDTSLLTMSQLRGACNTYYYRGNVKDSTGAVVKGNFSIIAIHFKSASSNAATIDGLWQISEISRPICGSSFCLDGDSCKGNRLIVDRNDPNAFQSIQAAVDSAHDCDTIIIAADGTNGPYKENVLIQDKSLVLEGAGKYQTIVDGSSLPNSVFTVKRYMKTASVTLADMTMQNGSAGGIYAPNNVALTMRDCVISGNHNAHDGGGIYAGTNCILTVVGSIISSNNADGDGGGIAIHGNTKVIDCIIGSKTGCTKDGNTAGFNGGGIGFGAPGDLTILRSIISGNTAENHGGTKGSGGIYWNGATGQLFIDDPNCVFGNFPKEHQILP